MQVLFSISFFSHGSLEGFTLSQSLPAPLLHTHTHTHTLLLFIQQASTVPGTGRFCGRVQGELNELNMMSFLEKYVISCVGSAGDLDK